MASFNSTRVSVFSNNFVKLICDNSGQKIVGIYYSGNVGIYSVLSSVNGGGNWIESNITGSLSGIVANNDFTKIYVCRLQSGTGDGFIFEASFTNGTLSDFTRLNGDSLSALYWHSITYCTLSNEKPCIIATCNNNRVYAFIYSSDIWNIFELSSPPSGYLSQICSNGKQYFFIADTTSQTIYYSTGVIDNGNETFSFTLTDLPTLSYPIRQMSYGYDSINKHQLTISTSNGIYITHRTDDIPIWTDIIVQAGTDGLDVQTIACDTTGKYIIAGIYNNASDSAIVYTSADFGVNSTITNFNPTNNINNTTCVTISKNGYYFFFNALRGSNFDLYSGTFPGSWICFKENTKILTSRGYYNIQDLRPGDMVKTNIQNEYKPIALIGYNNIFHKTTRDRIGSKLYKLTKSAYPELIDDLIITGNHSILLNLRQIKHNRKYIMYLGRFGQIGNLYKVPAYTDSRTQIYDKEGVYKVYHLALENNKDDMYNAIYANGLLVESTSKKDLIKNNMYLINSNK
jgi:hypothetical protein